MSDEVLNGKRLEALPETEEKPCRVCGGLTVVVRGYAGDIYCIEHDPILAEELSADGI